MKPEIYMAMFTGTLSVLFIFSAASINDFGVIIFTAPVHVAAICFTYWSFRK